MTRREYPRRAEYDRADLDGEPEIQFTDEEVRWLRGGCLLIVLSAVGSLVAILWWAVR